MKKIMFILPSIGFGGAEKVYLDIASSMVTRPDIQVELVYLRKLENEREIPSSLEATCLNIDKVRNGFLKLRRYLQERDPDLVLSGIAHLNVMLIILKKLFCLRFKLIVRHTSILSNELSQLSWRLKSIHKNMYRLYNLADSVVFQSEAMKDDFLTHIPLKNNGYKVINNPIDISKVKRLALEKPDFHLFHERYTFIFVGRLTKTKNVDYIIRKYINSSYATISNLLILGDGPEKEKLVNIVNSASMGERVIFLGNKKNPFNYIRNSDLLLLASESEGFPNIILESIALGTPVLIRKHRGGTQEIIDKLGVPERFVDDLEIHERHFLRYDEDVFGNLVHYFSLNQIVKKYIELIERV